MSHNYTAAIAHASRPAMAPSSILSKRLSRLDDLAHASDHLFTSPLGPFRRCDELRYLPQFIYFAPLTSGVSLRLAVLAGFGRHDLSAASAVVAFVENLVPKPGLGHGLNLSFFPVVNTGGLLDGDEERDLLGENWARSDEPEISLLSREVRFRGYDGFIRVATTSDAEPVAWVRTALSDRASATGVKLFSSEDFAPWAVGFETLASQAASSGPLSLVPDLPFGAFEVEIALPAEWNQARADKALAGVLTRLIVRHRAFHAYAQHL